MIRLAYSMMETGAVLDKYVQFHHLKTYPLKRDKLIEVQRHILSSLTNPATQQEQIETKSLLKTLFHQRTRINMRWTLNEQNLVLQALKGKESDESHYGNPLALLPV